MAAGQLRGNKQFAARQPALAHRRAHAAFVFIIKRRIEQAVAVGDALEHRSHALAAVELVSAHAHSRHALAAIEGEHWVNDIHAKHLSC